VKWLYFENAIQFQFRMIERLFRDLNGVGSGHAAAS
jgi:hypothetical protein